METHSIRACIELIKKSLVPGVDAVFQNLRYHV